MSVQFTEYLEVPCVCFACLVHHGIQKSIDIPSVLLHTDQSPWSASTAVALSESQWGVNHVLAVGPFQRI